LIIDHVEIGRLRLADGSEGRELARIGHDIADADVDVEHLVGNRRVLE